MTSPIAETIQDAAKFFKFLIPQLQPGYAYDGAGKVWVQRFLKEIKNVKYFFNRDMEYIVFF